MYVPAPPVPALKGAVASIIAEAGTLRAGLTAPTTPATSPKAVGPFRLRVWEQWGAADIGPAKEKELDGGPLAWEGDKPGVPDAADRHPLTLRYVIVDPLGRESDMESASAP
jgi:hypothetical protein